MFFPIKKQMILLFSLCLLFTFSPDIQAKDKWKPISPSELSMKEGKVDPDADAEAIFWDVRINDRSRVKLSLEHYIRVKIFTERGREKYSKFDIPYSKGKKIRNIAARVIRPDGSIVEINKKDIFERVIIKINKVKIKAKSFAIPNIEPGVIVEYRYEEIIRNAGAVGMKLIFQRDIPVQTISYYYKPFVKKTRPRFQPYNFTDTRFIKDKKGYYLAKRKNVPAFREEPRMPPKDMVRPWMLLQGLDLSVTRMSAYSVGFMIKDPSNPTRFWSAFALEKQALVKFVKKKDKNIKRTAEEITRSSSSKNEKLRKLYEFCQTQIHNTTFDPTLTADERDDLPKIKSIKDVLKKKQASSGYIDMLFGSMANSLGFDTRIVFSSDRSEMFFRPRMTNESFVRPTAIAIKTDGKWKFFNPGLKFLPYGMLAWYEENVWALLIGDKVYDWIRTPSGALSASVAKRKGTFKLLADGTLEGSFSIENIGQIALNERLTKFDESVDKRKEGLIAELKSQISTIEVLDVAIENMDNHHKPLIYRYKIKIPGYGQKTGKRLFFQPSVFENGKGPLFSSATRTHDIYFHHPWSETDDITIEMPKGFALDNAESPGAVVDKNKIGSLNIKMSIDQSKGILAYKRDFFFGGGGLILFRARMYQPLKDLFDSFHKADNHLITLKKEIP